MGQSEHKENTRKTISVACDSYDRLEAYKQPDESWSDLFDRLAESLQSHESGDEHEMNTLTEDHIEDIANQCAKRTVEELEAVRV